MMRWARDPSSDTSPSSVHCSLVAELLRANRFVGALPN